MTKEQPEGVPPDLIRAQTVSSWFGLNGPGHHVDPEQKSELAKLLADDDQLMKIGDVRPIPSPA